MALSPIVDNFGFHRATLYNVDTGVPYGTLRVVGSANISSSGELIPLDGGSNLRNWRNERGVITEEGEILFREIPDIIFELFAGKQPTAVSGEALGFVSTVTNKFGTSAVDATTGIASVTATPGDETDLKYGIYAIEVVTATTVNVYGLNSADFQQGTSVEYVDDSLLLNAAPLTITSGGTTVLADFGLDINGGGGAIAMTPGDTAIFEVRAINQGSSTVVIGGETDCFTNFGMILESQRQGNGQKMFLDIFEVVASGLPVSFVEKGWGEYTTPFKMNYVSSRGGVYKIYKEKGNAGCAV